MLKEIAKIPLKIISIRGEGYHCFVNVRINNVKARFILDTGASRTVLDLNFIKDLNLGEKLEKLDEKATGLGTNTMEGHKLKIEKIKIGKLIIKNYEAGILDLSHVNFSYHAVGMPKINGALGSDIMNEYKADISFGEKRLRLYK